MFAIHTFTVCVGIFGCRRQVECACGISLHSLLTHTVTLEVGSVCAAHTAVYTCDARMQTDSTRTISACVFPFGSVCDQCIFVVRSTNYEKSPFR